MLCINSAFGSLLKERKDYKLVFFIFDAHIVFFISPSNQLRTICIFNRQSMKILENIEMKV